MSLMPGSTTTRPRSATRSPSPDISTAIHHQGPLKRFRKTYGYSSQTSKSCWLRLERELAREHELQRLRRGVAGSDTHALDRWKGQARLHGDARKDVPR